MDTGLFAMLEAKDSFEVKRGFNFSSCVVGIKYSLFGNKRFAGYSYSLSEQIYHA